MILLQAEMAMGLAIINALGVALFIGLPVLTVIFSTLSIARHNQRGEQHNVFWVFVISFGKAVLLCIAGFVLLLIGLVLIGVKDDYAGTPVPGIPGKGNMIFNLLCV
jgi:hypothetical protein